MDAIANVDRFYLAGELVELWEDPDQPFRCSSDALERYLLRGDWVLAFNALVLGSTPIQGE